VLVGVGPKVDMPSHAPTQPRQEEMTDIERLALIQYHVVKLRRLAAEILDREISLRLSALSDEIEQRAREADRRQCSPK
jgi:hypothetical protein